MQILCLGDLCSLCSHWKQLKVLFRLYCLQPGVDSSQNYARSKMVQNSNNRFIWIESECLRLMWPARLILRDINWALHLILTTEIFISHIPVGDICDLTHARKHDGRTSNLAGHQLDDLASGGSRVVCIHLLARRAPLLLYPRRFNHPWPQTMAVGRKPSRRFQIWRLAQGFVKLLLQVRPRVQLLHR